MPRGLRLAAKRKKDEQTRRGPPKERGGAIACDDQRKDLQMTSCPMRR
jgi:hypothetical protein